MLSAISDYIWGGASEAGEENNENAPSSPLTEGGDQARASNKGKVGGDESEWVDEWIVVQADGKGDAVRTTAATLLLDSGDGAFSTPLPHAPSSPSHAGHEEDAMHTSQSDTCSDISTLPDNSPSNESWLVTPPPCFTAGTQPLRASSMENLLMEHTSMSVYQRNPGKSRRPPLPLRAMVARRRRRGDAKKESKSDTAQNAETNPQQQQQQLNPTTRPIHANHQLFINTTPQPVAIRAERQRQTKSRWTKSKAVMQRGNQIKGGSNPPRHVRTRYNQPCSGSQSKRC